MAKKRLLIIGSGGHAGQVIDAVNLVGEYEIVGLIDDFLPVGEERHGYKIIGKAHEVDKFKDLYDYLFIAIGNNFVRGLIWHKYYLSYKFANIIHPKASVSSKSSIADGVYIGANATVAYNSCVNSCAIVNTNASLDHDSILYSFASLNPNGATGGNVKIGYYTRVGMGVNIKDGVSIGSNCKIGMGCTIISDLPNDTTIKAHLLY